MLPPNYFYWFRIDNKHMTEPWLDQALLDSANKCANSLKVLVWIEHIPLQMDVNLIELTHNLDSTFNYWEQGFHSQHFCKRKRKFLLSLRYILAQINCTLRNHLQTSFCKLRQKLRLKRAKLFALCAKKMRKSLQK